MITATHGESATIKAVCGRPGGVDGKIYELDVLFPYALEGQVDTWGIDEGMASLLTGFVRAIKPNIILETGTHRGRSTRAICEGLYANGGGHLYTVDMNDYGLMTEGAIREHEKEYVTQIIGATPGIFKEDPLSALSGIDFAFLDGAHDKEGVMADLEYVDTHRAPGCTVLIDNARDAGWQELFDYLQSYDVYPSVSIPTMCGLHIIRMI